MHQEKKHIRIACLLCLISAGNICAGEDPALEALLPDSPGAAVLVMDQGKTIKRFARGVRRIDDDTSRCTSQTNFRLASISKQFTATAILLLHEDGKLSLDDKLDNFFDETPDHWQHVTIRNLLNHTSGIVDYEQLIPEKEAMQLSDQNALQLLLASNQSYFPAGTKFRYSNSGYVLLGLIVEAASGQTFHHFLQKRIFEPVGMNATRMYVEGRNTVSHRAYGHTKPSPTDAFRVDDQSLTSALRGDGGVYSSIDDLERWVRWLLGRRQFSEDTYRLLFTPQIETDRGNSHYGCGWFIDSYRGASRIYHNGGTRGFSLSLRMFPERRAAVILLLNCECPQAMESAVNRLADEYLFGAASP